MKIIKSSVIAAGFLFFAIYSSDNKVLNVKERPITATTSGGYGTCIPDNNLSLNYI